MVPQSNKETFGKVPSQEKTKIDASLWIGWLHPPFTGYQTDFLVSLSTGIVADCDKAEEIGLAGAATMNGTKFIEVATSKSKGEDHWSKE